VASAGRPVDLIVERRGLPLAPGRLISNMTHLTTALERPGVAIAPKLRCGAIDSAQISGTIMLLPDV
jgi:hypothetical protein